MENYSSCGETLYEKKGEKQENEAKTNRLHAPLAPVAAEEDFSFSFCLNTSFLFLLFSEVSTETSQTAEFEERLDKLWGCLSRNNQKHLFLCSYTVSCMYLYLFFLLLSLFSATTVVTICKDLKCLT